MKLFTDILPIILFFIVYKFYGIYAATTAAIAAATIQLAVTWVINRKLNKILLMNTLIIAILGSATLWLHNEMFIKWKPSIINWAFAIVFTISHFTGKPIMQRMMEKNVEFPPAIWQTLNWTWVGFFTIVGFINLYVVYHFDTDTWVNFKLFGMLGLTFVFAILQACYLSHLTKNIKTY